MTAIKRVLSMTQSDYNKNIIIITKSLPNITEETIFVEPVSNIHLLIDEHSAIVEIYTIVPNFLIFKHSNLGMSNLIKLYQSIKNNGYNFEIYQEDGKYNVY